MSKPSCPTSTNAWDYKFFRDMGNLQVTSTSCSKMPSWERFYCTLILDTSHYA